VEKMRGKTSHLWVAHFCLVNEVTRDLLKFSDIWKDQISGKLHTPDLPIQEIVDIFEGKRQRRPVPEWVMDIHVRGLHEEKELVDFIVAENNALTPKSDAPDPYFEFAKTFGAHIRFVSCGKKEKGEHLRAPPEKKNQSMTKPFKHAYVHTLIRKRKRTFEKKLYVSFHVTVYKFTYIETI
jgi:hypothetical protein